MVAKPKWVKDALAPIFEGSVRRRYALANLLRSPYRLIVSIAGIVVATFLMSVQGSLLFGFTMAASRIVDAVDADVWIVAKGTPAFDFLSPIERRLADLILGVPGVVKTGHVAGGWQYIQRPNGDRTFVYLVGVEPRFLGRLPVVATAAMRHGHADAALIIDETDRSALHVDVAGTDLQVGDRRAVVADIGSGFSSFLGTPYAFTTYADGRRYLALPAERSAAILVHLAPGIDREMVRSNIAARLPNVDVWTKHQFAWRSRLFWLIQTGAGGALSLAALLGFLIGLVLVAQTIYALTSEHIEEFATLKSMGATDADVFSIVLTQSLTCGVMGGAVGLMLVDPFAALARKIVTWIDVPPWMYAIVAALVVALCTVAAMVAARPALAVEPGRVFRA